jgi:PIN domain nuclease of toxin-antitoxin system
MNLLLDTHILLWSLLEPSRLSQRISHELENGDNHLWISPITTWETLILIEKGRIEIDSDPIDWIREIFSTVPLKEAPLNHEIAIQSRRIQLPHKDPADRFIAATAVVYGLTLVTADERLLSSDQFSLLPNK